jgi:hypothetical protein
MSAVHALGVVAIPLKLVIPRSVSPPVHAVVDWQLELNTMRACAEP